MTVVEQPPAQAEEGSARARAQQSGLLGRGAEREAIDRVLADAAAGREENLALHLYERIE